MANIYFPSVWSFRRFIRGLDLDGEPCSRAIHIAVQSVFIRNSIFSGDFISITDPIMKTRVGGIPMPRLGSQNNN